MNCVGKRIYTKISRPDLNVIECFRDVPVANISDCMNRMFVMRSCIRPIGKGTRLLGPAFTVKVPIGDNLLFNKALAIAKPGDVIVVDDSGDIDHSVCGDIMYRTAKAKGIAGFVIDGCVRDIDFLAEDDFPVFAIGVTPKGPYKNGPGEINVDIACCGQVVHPGDIIAADQDGVLVIRPTDVPAILESLKDKLASEAELSSVITDPNWVDTMIEDIVAEKNFQYY